MNILVFGSQGSGKSTHAEYLAEKLKVPYIYTGDLFRELEKENSARGERIRECFNGKTDDGGKGCCKKDEDRKSVSD